MRKVIFGCANSLDNFIARSDGGVDWLLSSADVNKIMEKFWKSIDTIVWGRKTFDFARSSGQGGGTDPGVRNYVCSRRWPPKKTKEFEVVNDAARLVRSLQRQKGKDICIMAGGDLATSLFDAKLIDEIGFNIHPVLLGSGVPLFHPLKRQINLKLIECRPIKKGCIYVAYRVKK
jgi:dihydrofolate reductase